MKKLMKILMNCYWGFFALKTTTAFRLMYSAIYAATNTGLRGKTKEGGKEDK
jgi:hypothetical protein